MARDTAAIGADVVIGENTPPVETTVEALIRQYNRQPLNSGLSTGDLVYWDATAGAWVRVAGTKSAGQLPVAQADGTVAWGNGSSQQLIAEQVLAADTATVTFASIPQTYQHLLIEYSVRSTRASLSVDTLQCGINGLGDVDHKMQYLRGNGATVSSAVVDGGAGSRGVGLITPDNATAGIFSAGTLWIPDYTDTTKFPHILADSHEHTGPFREARGVSLKSAAAVTSLTFTTLAATLKAGSVLSLYGVKGS